MRQAPQGTSAPAPSWGLTAGAATGLSTWTVHLDYYPPGLLSTWTVHLDHYPPGLSIWTVHLAPQSLAVMLVSGRVCTGLDTALVGGGGEAVRKTLPLPAGSLPTCPSHRQPVRHHLGSEMGPSILQTQEQPLSHRLSWPHPGPEAWEPQRVLSRALGRLGQSGHHKAHLILAVFF